MVVSCLMKFGRVLPFLAFDGSKRQIAVYLRQFIS